jgi:hypothetical protein
MNKKELKVILKPLIKECIKEVLFEEEGALSHIIKEVATGLSGKQQITEVKTFKPPKQNNQQMIQRKKKLLDAIGKDAYNGVNVFEGTTPAPAAVNESQAQGPLSGVAPNDPGVDISSIFSAKSFTIGQKMMGNE